MFLINPYRFASGSTLWNGLQAYYTADNTPNDALGTYNGTLTNGATYGTGKINQGFSFDGVNDYVNMGNVLDFDGSTPFSFNAWVKLSSSKFNCIISKVSPSPSYTGYIFRVDQSTNKLLLYLTSNSATSDYLGATSTNSTILFGFKMLTVTYDGSKSVAGVKFYIDGVADTTVSLLNSLTGSLSNSSSCTIGAAPNAGNQYINGLNDELGVWNRVLTSTEVTELYNAGAGKQYPN